MRRFIGSRIGVIASVASLLLSASKASATVIDFFSDGDATPTAGTVNGVTGGSVNVTLRFTASGTSSLIGTTYFITTNSVPASGGLAITKRDFTAANGFAASVLTDPNLDDATLGISGPGGLAIPTAPINRDLGSGAPLGSTFSNGTFTIATYTITVAPGTTAGTYTLSTNGASLGAGSSWTNAPPNPNDNVFGPGPLPQETSYTLTVSVPEPASAMVLGVIGAGALCFRRRRR